jgi:hypothetical protein
MTPSTSFSKRPARWAGLMGLVFLLSSFDHVCFAKSVNSSRETVLTRTERHFSGKNIQADQAFMLGHATLITGRKLNYSLDSFIEQNKDKATNLQYYLWSVRQQKLPELKPELSLPDDPNFDKSQSVFLMKVDPQYNDMIQNYSRMVTFIMGQGVWCPTGSKFTDLFGKPEYEYIVTHQLISIILARYRNCITLEDFEQNTGRYIVRIHNELIANQDRLSDVQVERAAFLMMAGRPKLVPQSFLKKLAAAQSKDGLWHFDEPLINLKLMPPEHTAALAYYVLSVGRNY